MKAAYPLSTDFCIAYEDLDVFAAGLDRPECVLAFEDGTLVASYGKGGYSQISHAGVVSHVPIQNAGTRQYVPNGVTVTREGRVLFADLGFEHGGIHQVSNTGVVSPVVTELDGSPLPPSNYVTVEDDGAIWFTVSTQERPRNMAWNHVVTDGYIAVQDERGCRVVADRLGYTNEIAFSPDKQWVYVNETYAQRVSRFRLLSGRSLGPRETVAQLSGADLPDGLVFDAFGGVWVSCIASNRLLLIRPDGQIQVILEDSDPAHVRRVADGIATSTLSFEAMQTAGRSRLGNISSLAFGGHQMRTAFLGCLLDDKIRRFDVPIEGAKPLHFNRCPMS